MVNKCAALNCSVRYPEKKGKTNDEVETSYTMAKVSSFHFSCETKIKELYDRENWVPTANSVLCDIFISPGPPLTHRTYGYNWPPLSIKRTPLIIGQLSLHRWSPLIKGSTRGTGY